MDVVHQCIKHIGPINANRLTPAVLAPALPFCSLLDSPAAEMMEPSNRDGDGERSIERSQDGNDSDDSDNTQEASRDEVWVSTSTTPGHLPVDVTNGQGQDIHLRVQNEVESMVTQPLIVHHSHHHNFYRRHRYKFVDNSRHYHLNHVHHHHYHHHHHHYYPSSNYNGFNGNGNFHILCHQLHQPGPAPDQQQDFPTHHLPSVRSAGPCRAGTGRTDMTMTTDRPTGQTFSL